MNELELIYLDTVFAEGWSPAELSPPFDLQAVLLASYRDHAPSHRNRARLDPQWFQG